MVGQGGVPVCDIKRRPAGPRACSSPQPGPRGVGASAGPVGVAAGLKGDSGRVTDPSRVQHD